MLHPISLMSWDSTVVISSITTKVNRTEYATRRLISQIKIPSINKIICKQQNKIIMTKQSLVSVNPPL